MTEHTPISEPLLCDIQLGLMSGLRYAEGWLCGLLFCGHKH